MVESTNFASMKYAAKHNWVAAAESSSLYIIRYFHATNEIHLDLSWVMNETKCLKLCPIDMALHTVCRTQCWIYRNFKELTFSVTQFLVGMHSHKSEWTKKKCSAQRKTRFKQIRWAPLCMCVCVAKAGKGLVLLFSLNHKENGTFAPVRLLSNKRGKS